MAHPFQRKQLATRVLAWVLVTLLFSIAVLAAIYRIWPRRWKRDQGGHPKSALLGSHRSFPAGEQNLALYDDPAPAAQDFT